MSVEDVAEVMNVSVSYAYKVIQRMNRDEERYITIGLVYKVLTVVYCDRENKLTGHTDIRIISARVATKTEQMMYNNNLIGRY